jgi:uncharacterized membrane protein YphA (DoxX/SURF4 family)
MQALSSLPQLLSSPLLAEPSGSETQTWSWFTRFAFRFCFVYFVLFCLCTQLFSGLFFLPGLAILPPVRQLVFWFAAHLFGYKQLLVYFSGSGDKVFDWVLVFCLLVISAIGTCVWSTLDRRPSYTTLYHWFRVLVRFALAGQMLNYGFIKVFPMQMSFPPLVKLLERFGDFSPMGVLWSSIGASPAYERFVGGAELLAGILLVIPAASRLGALIAQIDVIEVFVLNMTYDVPVKLFSFHLVWMAAFLLIPERLRLIQFCLLDCPVSPARSDRLFTPRDANRIATVSQLAFGAFLFLSKLLMMSIMWYMTHGSASQSPLYGIWNVNEMTIDGQTHPPLLTDSARYRRVVFDSPQLTTFQRMDDTFAHIPSSFDRKNSTLTLSLPGSMTGKGQLTASRKDHNHLTLQGRLGSQAIHMELTLLDRNQFTLVNRGFHWIQEYPFNR